ncbi:MAG: hypothetical protein ACTS3F_04385 [Phycisphaerales bacterium]
MALSGIRSIGGVLVLAASGMLGAMGMVSMGGCAGSTGYSGPPSPPPPQVRDVYQLARELSEEMIAAGVITSDDGQPADIIIRQYKNDTTNASITRERVVIPIMQSLLRSGVARPFDIDDPDVADAIDRAQFEGRTLERLYDYSLFVRLYEDRVTAGVDREMVLTIQLELQDNRPAVPRRVWIDQREFSRTATRQRIGT